MPRFNRARAARTGQTVNLAGGEAFAQSPEVELATLVLTSFVTDQFYRDVEFGLDHLTVLLDKVDPLFAAKAAIYARTQYHMRSITHALAGELAHRARGLSWTRGFFESVVERPDDITEILAYYFFRYGSGAGKPPNAMKDGLARAFGRFDRYQLAKYRAGSRQVSLVDAMNLLHPRPTERNQEALALLAKDQLRSTETWESRLTKAGEAETDEIKVAMKGETWASLLRDEKLGYFALLRNLRNIAKQAPEALDTALNQLVDSDRIKGSKVLPFRFDTALEAVSGLERAVSISSALNVALEQSLENVPVLEGRTLVAVDNSGSMVGRPQQIATLFGAVLFRKSDADVLVFSEAATFLELDQDQTLSVIADQIKAGCEPGGTNFRAMFEIAQEPYDRIIILSDMQSWVGRIAPVEVFTQYKERTGADPKIFSFDLAGYGTVQFPQADIYCLAGFSDRVFDVMSLLETDKEALVNQISAVTFKGVSE